MINLLSGGAIQRLTDYRHSRYLGLLAGPSKNKPPTRALEMGWSWAADNGCYVRYDPAAILRMLERYQNIPHCLFVNAPDVVGNHAATLFLFWFWQPIIRYYGYPVAFTLQNGVTLDAVPWAYCEALFIGGSTDFKFTPQVARIVATAKRRGLWVHAGRVNTMRRIKYMRGIGCDSFDGLSYARWQQYIPKHFPLHSTDPIQHVLWSTAA